MTVQAAVLSIPATHLDTTGSAHAPPLGQSAGRDRTRDRSWRLHIHANASAVIIGIVYLAFALYFFEGHRHQINPDGVSYLSIAQKYLAGRFHDAVNASWSPLYCWLLVPLLAAGIEPIVAPKVLGVLVGAATLVPLWRLAAFAGACRRRRTLICLAAVPLLVYAAYAAITPDALLACMLLLFLAAICQPARDASWRQSATLGLLGGLAYLAKAYALPFVLGYFCLVRLIELLRSRDPRTRRSLIGHGMLTLLVLAIVVGAWGAALTAKYGWFMTGSAGRYNLRFDGPTRPPQVVHSAGLLAPPNPTALSAWEDLTYQINRLPAWRPWDSVANLKFLARQIRRNLGQTAQELAWFTPWWSPILLGLLLLSVDSRARPVRPGVICALAVLIYPCGYLLLHVERRFLFPLPLLLLIGSAGFILSRAVAAGLLSAGWQATLAAAVIGATFIASPTRELLRTRGVDAEIARVAQHLKATKLLPPGSRFASDAIWSKNLYLAFYLDLRYFGQARPGQTSQQLQADLARHEVEYLFVWNQQHDWPAGAGWTELSPPAEGAAFDDLPFRIYRRPAPPTSTATPPPDAH